MDFLAKLLSLLGGSAESAPQATAPVQRNRTRHVPNAAIRDSWLTLTEPEFFGQAHVSPSGRWVVGCDDSDGASHGGQRERGNGRVILVDLQSDKVLHELKGFARPIDACVCDKGSYIVHDAGFGSALQGDIVSMGIDGRERYRRRYQANLIKLCLSKCGRYAAVQTANAPGSDGNLLEVLDLDRACGVFSVHPTNWADNYSFDVDADGRLKALGVEHKGLGTFTYSASGEFHDAGTFQTAQLEKGDYSTKIRAARDLMKTAPSPENARRALSAVNAALAEGSNNRPDWASIAHRVCGESYELLEKFPEALAAYDRALSLNPKIGVQKRATVLRKKLRTG